MRITVSDVFDALGSGLSISQVLEEYPYLVESDIQACFSFAADRVRKLAARVA